MFWLPFKRNHADHFRVWHGKILEQISYMDPFARLWSRPQEVTNIYGACWCRPWDGCKSKTTMWPGDLRMLRVPAPFPTRLALSGMKAGFLFTKASGALRFLWFLQFPSISWRKNGAKVWIMSYKTVLFNSLMMEPWLTICSLEWEFSQMLYIPILYLELWESDNVCSCNLYEDVGRTAMGIPFVRPWNRKSLYFWCSCNLRVRGVFRVTWR